MKKAIFCGMMAVCGLVFGLMANHSAACAAEESKSYEVAISDADANKVNEASLYPCTVKDGETIAPATNCCYRYYYRCYYPAIYYRQVYCVSYTCYYRYRYIVYYNDASLTNDTNQGEKGFLMETTPEAGTPLAKLGVKKGDIITKINGKALTSAADIDQVTENSTLSILKNSVDTARTSSESSTESGSSTLSDWLSDL